MNGISLWLGLLGAEIVLVVLLLLLVAWLRNRAMARRDRKAVAMLIKHAREAKSQREQVINDYLMGLGLQGESLQAGKTRILNEELRLLQRFADTYGKRDAASAAQFFIHAEAALAPYHEIGAQGVAETAPAAGAGDPNELEKLRKENARLSEELSVSMDTMSRMLSEYSTMFSTSDSEDSLSLVDEPEEAILDDGGEPEPVREDDAYSVGEGREQPGLESGELDIGEDLPGQTEILSDEPMEIDMPDEPAATLDEEVLPTDQDGDELLPDTLLDLDETVAMTPPETDVSDTPEHEQADALQVADEQDDTGELDLGVEDLDALFDDDEAIEAPSKHGANTISI